LKYKYGSVAQWVERLLGIILYWLANKDT